MFITQKLQSNPIKSDTGKEPFMKQILTLNVARSAALILILILSTGHVHCSGKNNPQIQQDEIVLTGQDTLGNDSHMALQRSISQSRQNAITNAVADVSPAIVGINVTQIKRVVRRSYWDDDFFGWFFPQREYKQRVKGLGSGFLISTDGYILSNEHVVSDAVEIVVTTTDGKQFEAKKVGEDATYDVALLKIEGSDFPYIPLGDSDHIIIGEWAIALGNPFGLFDVSSKPTVTVGVVSATGLNFKGDYAFEGRSYQDMIQTDASINGGNSGGPLVDSMGRCIGINTFIISGSDFQKTSVGIGFAIPINRVKKILPDLRTVGKVDRSFYTGLEVENISWLDARALGISNRDGVMVTVVSADSPAEKAGIRKGDVIVIIDGNRIRSTRDVQKVINGVDITENNRLEVTIYREGEIKQVEMRLVKSREEI
ncbi:hypothetical protein BVY01_02695 [bacterium I07]|nr:hypothetical protein BVY01_02695 [bacterium I07]